MKLDNKVCYGQSDIDLADTFESEIDDLKKKIAISPQMVFYSSPLKRCFLLAKKLSQSDPIIDKRLIEISFGDWELKKWDSINKAEFQNWLDDFIFKKCPNGESYFDLFNRARDFFKEVVKKEHKKVVIITHSGVIRSIFSYILKISLKNSFIIQIDYGGVSKININHSKDIELLINIEYINK